MPLSRLVLAAGALLLGAGEVRPGEAFPAAPGTAMETAAAPGELRVMTYNVKGLPWPIATGRPAQLEEIGRQLRAMREAERQPHILLLQEAFTAEAKAIGRIAGYRYVAFGPRPGSATLPGMAALPSGYAAAASGWKGEGLGQWLDGGLAIFSDYPITASSAAAFPAAACAGFDCLATKGVLVARVRVPGSAQPVTVVNTHLNSDVSSTGVDAARSDASFAWQFAALQRAAAAIPAGEPVIFAGDVNIGPTAQRRLAATRLGAPLRGAIEAMPRALANGTIPAANLVAVRRIQAKRIDQVFARPGRTTGLEQAALAVPFDTGQADSLSDHAAIMVTYRLATRGAFTASPQ